MRRPYLPVLDHGRTDLAPAPYLIRINGHPGATLLSAFPALAPHHHGAHTVLTGLLDRSALYGDGFDVRAERPPADAAMALVLVGLPAPGSGDRRGGC